ncbi:hypothetical protein [Campylobacter ureolyticus]|uniref:hypothetical protein n=1 Tax=Campylobacter ureolyticus TaxID=827 RepID=UPI0022B4E19A|nr:hypothetical protein [Campylobacter ureolyticus]MCZ6132303.1 hypothetical protein [Campylobacter ureolyticus]
MNNYIIKPLSIRKNEMLNRKDFCRYSLCPKDYRQLKSNNTNLKDFSNFIIKKIRGKEIGSNSYIKKSNYRFLKTSNLGDNFLLDETTIEYCKKTIYVHPKQNDILIVKDGKGNGLGEVVLYDFKNENNYDLLSAGILGARVKIEYLYYILGILKTRYFKNFIDVNTAQGSTMRHSKEEAYNFYIPFPTRKNNQNPKDIENLVSLIVQNIIDKEKLIKLKNKNIDEQTMNELKANQKAEKFKYSYPKINELKEVKRLDTGLYEKEYKLNYSLIKNYSNGYFNIPIENFKSGSTPKIRIFNAKRDGYRWITPTNIEDVGFYKPIEKIFMPTTNNLKKDAILFINRTSKGKKGEYVGISCFYDYKYYGQGHHNQGIYRVENFKKDEKLFIVAFMNANIMRKICGCISIGSKMQEMKIYDFSKLIFPCFPEKVKKVICKNYYNEVNVLSNLTLDNYLKKHKERNKSLGIFQLNMEMFELKKKLEELVYKILMNKPIIINEYFN